MAPRPAHPASSTGSRKGALLSQSPPLEEEPAPPDLPENPGREPLGGVAGKRRAPEGTGNSPATTRQLLVVVAFHLVFHVDRAGHLTGVHRDSTLESLGQVDGVGQ